MLPSVEAERWRFMEQRVRQYEVDIQRLWRRIQDIQDGATAFSDALTPDDLAALTIAGTGDSGTSAIVYTLAVRGNSSSGTITIAISGGLGSVTINYDDTPADITTTFEAAVGSGNVIVVGGDLRWNACKIKLADSTLRLSITAQSLGRETYGVEPRAELSYCPEPASIWT